MRTRRWISVRLGWIAASLALLALAPSTVHAQFASPDARARELYIEGDRHYQEGRYEQAVQAFQESYRLSGRPLLLFNLANAYERLGRYQDALEALRGYAPHAPFGEQAQVRARIASLEQRAREAPTQPAAPAGAPRGDDALIVTGIVVGGVGLVMGAGGVAMGLLALDARSRAQAGCATTEGVTLCDESARGALEDDSLFALLADVGMFVGGAALVAGVVLAIVGWPSGSGGESAVVPWIAPRADGGELGVVIAF